MAVSDRVESQERSAVQARLEYEALLERRRQANWQATKYNFVALASLLVLVFLGLGVRHVWGLTPSLSLIALGIVVFLGVGLLNIRNVIRWQHLVWQTVKAKQRMRAAEYTARTYGR